MSSIRFLALSEVLSRKTVQVEIPTVRTSEYFAENVFTRANMQKYLSKEAFEHVLSAISEGKRIERNIAGQIAIGMKAWAVDRGATHYTHWFHPLTGATAEKHDAFFEPAEYGVIERFRGAELVQQEPDASSFPSGGIRNTFEARGYTAWDPSSPAFIVSKTLCIPTIFVSYTGEALDYKTPLLKSLNFLDKTAVAVCNLFDQKVTKVIATLGWEQEYFLVDEALYQARPDLKLTGRTLMGHQSAKDQQLEDHYFGSIPDRALAFMRDFEFESYKLGIPIKTRHNEVAPNQYECAPVFEEANLAIDHNQLLMDIMGKIARKYQFRVLFHEKPYKGINGSGKHNNWSLMTNTGVNLLSPAKTSKGNLQFLTFLINVVKAVYEYADILRASIATAGNEHRLGANEAPPAIISVFLGETISAMLDKIENQVGDALTPEQKEALELNLTKIPEILLDNTDRNRTSPFAFTGNRFEFRAVGASANCAPAITSLCTVVANQLSNFIGEYNQLIEKNISENEAILQILRKYIKESKAVRFEGNGYSNDWIEEAKRRGLNNFTKTPDALKSLLSHKSKEVFNKNNILTERELEARYEISLETYIKIIQIEARVLGDLVGNHIIPVGIRYQNSLTENVKGLKEIFGKEEYIANSKYQIEIINDISKHIAFIKQLADKLVDERKIANKTENINEKAQHYSIRIKPIMDEIRYHVDKLELIVDDEIWPLPKYRELLFTR